MKKTLILVRHASAEDNNFEIKDFDRPLIEKGLSEATVMGKWLADKKINPDQFISSLAPRARKTAEIMAEQLNYNIDDILLLRSLYDGGPNSYLNSMISIDESINTLILFGHNPDITFFGEYLSGKLLMSMKKCSIAIIEFENQKWEEISAKTGRFISYTTPKQIREDI